MPTATTRYALTKPTVGGDADTWGTDLNANLMDKLDALMGAPSTTGSGAAYVLTSGGSITAYAQGQTFRFKASFTCNGAATLNVDGLGAKNITKNGTTATVSGDVISGNVYLVVYDGTQFQIVGGYLGVTGFQTLDADLTAIAALGYTSGSYLIKKTAADTWALVDEASYVHLSGTETITGAKTFSAEQSLNGGWRITTAVPVHYHKETGAGADAKLWKDVYFSGQYLRALVNDAESAQNVIYSETRTGYASAVAEYFLTDLRLTDAPTSLATNSAGFRGAPQNVQSGDYTFVMSDAGKSLYHNSGSTHSWTIPPNSSVAFPLGTTIVVYVPAGTVNIVRGSGVTLLKGDGSGVTDANRTMTTVSIATLYKAATDTWVITGAYT